MALAYQRRLAGKIARWSQDDCARFARRCCPLPAKNGHKAVLLLHRPEKFSTRSYTYGTALKFFLRRQFCTNTCQKMFYRRMLVRHRPKKFSTGSCCYCSALKIFLRRHVGTTQSLKFFYSIVALPPRAGNFVMGCLF